MKKYDFFEKDSLYECSEKTGEILKDRLMELEDHPLVGHVRGKGLLIGIELVEDKKTKTPVNEKVVNEIIGHCKNKGLIVGKNGDTVAGYTNIIALSPPLNIKEDDLNFLINTLKEVFAQI